MRLHHTEIKATPTKVTVHYYGEPLVTVERGQRVVIHPNHDTESPAGTRSARRRINWLMDMLGIDLQVRQVSWTWWADHRGIETPHNQGDEYRLDD